MLDSPPSCCITGIRVNRKTGNLSDNPATWRKAQGKGREYEDKGKTSQEKNKGMKKNHHVLSGY